MWSERFRLSRDLLWPNQAPALQDQLRGSFAKSAADFTSLSSGPQKEPTLRQWFAFSSRPGTRSTGSFRRCRPTEVGDTALFLLRLARAASIQSRDGSQMLFIELFVVEWVHTHLLALLH
jgi:hypothetical protein